jgi:hypothetical protein
MHLMEVRITLANEIDKPANQEKPENLFDAMFSAEKIEFIDTAAEKSYVARAKRIKEAIQLKVPDRVPVMPAVGSFPAFYSGMTLQEVMYDANKACRAVEKYLIDFTPDAAGGFVAPAKPYDILDYKQYQWPGPGRSPESPIQYVEGEYMKAEEYDALIRDPSDFWMRVYLPRAFGALEPFSKLMQFSKVIEIVSINSFVTPFGLPEVQDSFQALFKAGEEVGKWRQVTNESMKRIRAAGFPVVRQGNSWAPFDLLGDTLRGTRGIMMDMYRRPEKILEALEKLTPLMVRLGADSAFAAGSPLVFMPLHKGADGFMSDTQFKTFYWPTLKKVIQGLTDEGYIPFLFAEGSYNTRLETVQELDGKVIWRFDETDMAKAKEILGKKACLYGNVPAARVAVGTPETIKAYCKKLIDIAGKGGGFILSTGSSIEKAPPENVHALIDFSKEYGS